MAVPSDPAIAALDPAASGSAAVAALYDAHAELVWKCLHRLGVRKDDLPDLLQEVFLVVHRRRGELDPARPIEPFLWGIALGLVRNYRRRAFRRLEVAGEADERAGSSDPERDLIASRQRQRLDRALAELDPEKRAVFVMFELEGLSGQDIAAALGIAVGTVHSRLHAARGELSAAVREHPSSGRAPSWRTS